MPKTILVVDDKSSVRQLLREYLTEIGYEVVPAGDGRQAIYAARHSNPDLILLDIMMPEMDGYEFLRQYRREKDTPVIVITAREEESDAVLGLELGADDYVTKPFDLDVLLARIKAVLRRSGGEREPPPAARRVEVGDLLIDPAAHTITLAGQPVELSPREFALLHALALQPNTVISTEALLAQVWGAEFVGQPQVVYVHIRWLREKLEDDPKHPLRILTVRGVGYKLQPQET